jgi:hypothetical protein
MYDSLLLLLLLLPAGVAALSSSFDIDIPPYTGLPRYRLAGKPLAPETPKL